MKIAIFRKRYDYRTDTSSWMVEEVYNLNEGDVYGTNELVDGSMRLLEEDVVNLETINSDLKFKVIDENDYTFKGTFPVDFNKVNSKFSEYEDFGGVHPKHTVINKQGYTIFQGEDWECINYAYQNQDKDENDSDYAYAIIDGSGAIVENY